MKTRITTAVLLFALFISVNAFSIEPVPAPASKAVAQSVAQLIEQELDYPEFAIKEKFEGNVVVDVLIQNDGTFNVQAANCVNDDMKEHVIKIIEDLEPNDFSRYAGQTVLIKVKFDLKLS